MLITNQTNQDYWFGPLHLPAGVGTGQLTVDDSSATSLYLTDDGVADAINTLLAQTKIQVTSVTAGILFPRPTGTPEILHGDGSPEGLIYAGQGSMFMVRTAASATNYLYTKTTGIHLNTGWVAINPGAAGLTGQVNANGTIAAGTGFTITHTGGTGVYTVNFNVAFAAAPLVLCQQVASGNCTVSSVTTSAFSVSTQGAADSPFNFTASVAT